MLTNLLLEDLKKAAGEENGDARIIMVTSSAHAADGKRKQSTSVSSAARWWLRLLES